LLVALGERLSWNRLTGGVLRRHLVQRNGYRSRGQVRVSGAHRRRSRHHAVEAQGIPLCHEHGLTSAGRAADEVRLVDRLAVVLRDDLLGQYGYPANGGIGEIERRL